MNVMRALVIEDNPADARLFRELMREVTDGFGFELTFKETLRAGLEEITLGKPDLVFLDLGLPDSRGLSTYESLRRASPRLPVVILSGLNDEETAVLAVQAGAQDYLVKGEVNGRLLSRAARYAVERKKSEEILRESESRFRLFFENVPEYCYMVSGDGTILDVNESAMLALGYGKGELVGRKVEDLYAPEFRAKASELLQKWRATGRIENEEMIVLSRDGSRRLVLLSAGASPGGGDGSVSTVSVQRDITELKKLEEQLLRSQKSEAIGRLAGGVAHDFNNLLGVITGYGEIVMQQLSPGHPAAAHVGQILAAADRAAGLTRQLLLFSRRQALEARIIDVDAVIRNLAVMIRRLIGEDVDLKVSASERRAFIKADPGQIEQVVMNLAVNARDAMAGGGALRISTSVERLSGRRAWHGVEIPDGEYVVLKVGDSGIGMDDRTLSHLFEPLFTTKPEGKGTGLGLATVFGIVKQHGGYVGVQSSPGKGTTLSVIFTLAAAAPSPDETDRPPDVGLRGCGSILLVEDEAALREIMISSLQEYGYSVTAASQGEEALEKAETMPVLDLLVTDMVMPIMNGARLAERLAALRPELRVLFITGYTEDVAGRGDAIGKGAAFLDKPFTPQTLARRIKETLALPVYGG